MKRIIIFSLLFSSTLFFMSCEMTKKSISEFNLFTIENDKQLGKEVAMEIESNPQEYPILDSAKNATAYKYLYDIRDRILNAGKVELKNNVACRLRIIHDDQTKNAFCTPGGYIYVYTGLIKYLDYVRHRILNSSKVEHTNYFAWWYRIIDDDQPQNAFCAPGGYIYVYTIVMKYLESEEQLAGVLAHEIGHADLRHSTRQMTKLYGVETLLNFLAGDRALIKNLTTNIIRLKFSRTHKTKADKASVTYLYATDYVAAGGAKFFEKIEAEGGVSVPEWLSTHPSPDNRIEYFYNQSTALGCTGTETYKARYQQLLRALPN